MNQQLETTIVENIRRTFNEANSLAEDASQRGKEAIFKARECGQFLIEARENAPGKKLKPWLMSHVTFISYETAARWVRLAETPLAELEQALSLRQAYIAAGILPEPSREAGSQQSHPEGQRWLSGLLKGWEAITATLEKRPLTQWPETQRITLKEKLKPYAELYARL